MEKEIKRLRIFMWAMLAVWLLTVSINAYMWLQYDHTYTCEVVTYEEE